MPPRHKPTHVDTLALAHTFVRTTSLIQQGSAIIFSSFLVLHLCSPLAAAFSSPGQAESSASSFMLLSRVWYQDGWMNEVVVVWGSLAAHIGSGVIGRIGKGVERRLRRARRVEGVKREAEGSLAREIELGGMVVQGVGHEQDERGPPLDETVVPQGDSQDGNDDTPRPKFPLFETLLTFLGPITLLHTTGYVLVPLTLSHINLHRLLPSLSAPPISSLSPTLFSYSFTSYSLNSRLHRLRSSLSYGLLVTIAGYHVIAGMRRYIDPTSPRGLRPRRGEEGEGRVGKVKRHGWQAAYGGVVAGVGLGLVRLALEGAAVPAFLARKYDAVLTGGRALV
ncbi:hypothetical protein MNV49_003161 [Pseudohyphozyma bogoriensis]|nr:hypothetical protein MNV49_003161 [Pseudohyphozyma bogoriensis]